MVLIEVARPSSAVAAARRALVLCVALLAVLLAPLPPAHAVTLPAGFSQTTIASGLGFVTGMAFAPDGRLFVISQNGTVRVVRDGTMLPTPFLKLTVDARGERGLLGIAFDPDFLTNRYVYLYYTVPGTPAFNRVSRFVAQGDVAQSTAAGPVETRLVDLDPLSADSLIHNAGAMAFGPDGKLYIAVGDNGIGTNAQDLSNRLGKVLRVEKDGTAPADNPFAGRTVGVDRSIWAIGLRNPFSFGFSRTGQLFINDVGQDVWEEIDEGRAGANYGWPLVEGPTTDPAYTSPLYAYRHTGTGITGCAITGGAFYDPQTPTFPSDHVGDYFFADFCSDWIKRRDADGTVSDFISAASPNPVDVKVGPDGALYYLARGDQSLNRVRYSSSQLPVVTQQPVSQTVSAGEPASFRVAASGAAPLSYQWQRDGVDVSGATSPTLQLAGTTLGDDGSRFRCVVRNAAGTAVSADATLAVLADRRPTATITTPAAGTTYVGGQVVTYAGSGADPESGDLPDSALTWQVDFHHAEHSHPFIAPTSGTGGGSFVVPTSGHVDSNVWYRIRLTVKDPAGLTSETHRDVLPRTSGLTLATQPPGLRLDLDGQPRVTPHQEQAVVGLQRQLSAPVSQQLDGVDYEFVSWSDTGGASHPVTTGAEDTTYTATYRATGTRTLVLSPVADAVARQQAPSTAAGSAVSLLSDTEETSGTASRATPYLRFTVPTLAAGESIMSASLSVHVSNATTNGPAVWRTGTSWSESTLSWNAQPARSGTAAVGGFGAMAVGRTSTTISGVTGAGQVSLQLYAEAADGVVLVSRDGVPVSNRPQLVLRIRSGSASVPQVPTSVAAVGDDAARTATLSWAPPAGDGGSPVTGYRVARDGTDAGGTGPWSTTVAATARSFLFSDLAAGSTYRLSVQAINAAGTGPAASASVTTGGSGTRTLVLTPVADAVARQQAPSTAAGSAVSLLSDSEETSGTASRATSYLRFTVPTLAAGESVTAASLSLQVSNATTDGPAVWRTGTTWAESTLSWNAQPARSGTAAVGGFGAMAAGRVSTPLSGVTGAGDVSLQLYAEAADGVVLASREAPAAADRPQLVLTVRSGSSAPTAPTAPTSVVMSKDDAARSATISWAPPAGDGGSPVTGYRVARDGVDAGGTGPWSTTVAATARSFLFTNLAAGATYRLSVEAVNAVGTGPAASGSVTIGGSSTRTLVLSPVADAVARQQAPSTAAGSAVSLLSDTEETSGTASRATPYLRFTVPTLAAGESIMSASLSVHVSNATTNGPAVWRTGTSWSESTLSWNAQPARSGTAAVGGFGAMAVGRTSTTISGVTGAGQVSLQLYAEAADGVVLASREAPAMAERPQLVLVIGSAA